jgi:hypothetical protein
VALIGKCHVLSSLKPPYRQADQHAGDKCHRAQEYNINRLHVPYRRQWED